MSASAAPQPLGDHHRPVPAAGAADRDRQVALPFRDVVRQDEAQVLLQPVHELAGRRVALHELGDRPVAAGPPPQRRHEMRIRQAAHVEHEVGVDRHAVLEAEAEDA